jgi:hypothetical protein
MFNALIKVKRLVNSMRKKWNKAKAKIWSLVRFVCLLKRLRKSSALKVIGKKFPLVHMNWKNITKATKLCVLVNFCETSLTEKLIYSLMGFWRYKVCVIRLFLFNGK